MKTALLLYPHQLFPLSDLPDVDAVIMVEDPLFFGYDRERPLKMHKQKIILHRASMRRYVKEVLWENDIDVDYIELDGLFVAEDIFDRARKFEKLYVFDPVHEVISRRLLEARRNTDDPTELEFLASPQFLLKDQEVREFFQEKHQKPFDEFYKWQRERFDVLIDKDYKPMGGEWQYKEHASKLSPKQNLPSFQSFGSNEYVDEAKRFVQERFNDNPGEEECIWPTNHQEARAWLDDFVAHRLGQYAAYKNTINSEAPWLYHSALSSSLNIGLLHPEDIIKTAVTYYEKHNLPLESVEVFVRQILGWREFNRGFYVSEHARLLSSNPFKQHRRITAAWYSGDLGIPPYDDVIKKVKRNAYAHEAERLDILQNLMILAEIHPDDIYAFFSSQFVDAQEWAVVPAAYGPGVNLHGKPVTKEKIITPSSHIVKQSDYERDQWADVWDGLYWRFVEKHKGLLLHNPSTRTIAQRLERLDADHRRIIGYRADDFLKQYTLL